jgi:hypothetical protein
VYRPNESKVKNLKAKDYLGKARLVAATDRGQTFTGFTGAELKRMNSVDAAKDDRPEEKISYAASNLVKPDLRSRNRQQSEPPLNRNVFPPTPPPESDKPPSPNSSRSTKTAVMSRADSVKAGPKPRPLDLSVAGFAGSSQRTGLQRAQSERGGPRAPGGPAGPQRELPLAPQRAMSDRRSAGSGNGQRSRRSREDSDNGYAEDLYDMYGRQSSNPSRRPARETYISEEDEVVDDNYANSYDEADFEMVSSNSNRRESARRSGPAMKKIRVKVHADDTRYVMVGTAVEFRDFIDQIRAKFGIRQSFKVKIKDDADMITMADQDDLDMAIETAKSAARKERSEMGKMEVCFVLRSFLLECFSR